jgi:hypothetical protein
MMFLMICEEGQKAGSRQSPHKTRLAGFAHNMAVRVKFVPPPPPPCVEQSMLFKKIRFFSSFI